MTIIVEGGWLDGNKIRRARKATHCNNWRHCPDQVIRPGTFYTELECDPDVAGGFGMKKLCMVCAGEEARQSLPAEPERAAFQATVAAAQHRRTAA